MAERPVVEALDDSAVELIVEPGVPEHIEPPRDAATRDAAESPPRDAAEPPREERAAESSSNGAQREAPPSSSRDEVPLRDSQPLPLPERASQPAVEPAASSIDAAVQRATVLVDAALTATPSPKPTNIEIDARDRQALAATVKRIIGMARDGSAQLAFQAYADLFENNDFVQQRPQDQRQVLKLMVMAKSVPPRSPPVIKAYRNALVRLEKLVAETNDAGDQEMLGVCQRALAKLDPG